MSDYSKLQFFPISFFAMTMGLAGLCIALIKAQKALNSDFGIDGILAIVTGAVFLMLTVVYLLKLINHFSTVLEELQDPTRMNYFAAFSISLLLLSTMAFPHSYDLSAFLWGTGTLLQLLFIHYVMDSWVHHEHYEIDHINPAWFIPIIGNVLVPLTGKPLGYVEISWFFFSVGIVFWLVLFVIIFNRVLFHHPMEGNLMPTVFIMIAPPAVGFLSYMELNGDIDNFARVLYYSALFMTLLFIIQAPRFVNLPFSLSWWAYSFPFAAITIATYVMFEFTASVIFQTIGLGLLCLTGFIVVFLLYLTIQAAFQGLICRPDEY